MDYNNQNGMTSNEKPSSSADVWIEIKEAIDLYRTNNKDAHISDTEWREVKQACEYILQPYGLWDNANDRVDETKVHNVYMNLR